jgi:hypothetical protein
MLTKSWQGTTSVYWMDDNETIEITADCSYDIEPYDKGDWYTPPSGGGLSGWVFTITKIRLWGPSGADLTLELNDDLKKFWVSELDRLMERDDAFGDRVQEACYKDLSERNQSRYD